MPKKRQVFTLFVAFYSAYCFSNLYYFLNYSLTLRGISSHQTGMILSVFFLSMLLYRPFSGPVIELLGVRTTLAMAGCLMITGGIMVALAKGSIGVLLAGRILGGLGFSSFVVGIVSYQSIAVPPENRGRSFSLVTIGSILPIATIVPVTEWLISKNSGTLFLWIAPAIGLACLFVGRLVETAEFKRAQRPSHWGSYTDLLKVPGFKTLFLFQFYLSFSEALSLSLPNFAAVSGQSVSLFMLPAATASILFRLAGFRLMERIPRVLLVPPAAVLIALGFFLTGLSPQAFGFTLGGFLFGLGMGAGFPTHLSLIGDLLPKELHPKGTAALFFAGDLSWTVSPLLVGLVRPFLHNRGVFLLFPFFALVAISATIFFLWRPFCASHLARNRAGER